MGCPNSKSPGSTGDIDDDFKAYSKYAVKPVPPQRRKSVKFSPFSISNVRGSSRNPSKRPAPSPPLSNAGTRSDVKPTEHRENPYSIPPTTEGGKSDAKQISIIPNVSKLIFATRIYLCITNNGLF